MKLRILALAKRLAALSLAVFILGWPHSALAQANAAPGANPVDDLVAINRMLSSREVGVLGAYGHVSIRSSKNPDRYFISRAVSPGVVMANDIYESDLEGNPVPGKPSDLIPERFIDGEIYKSRPDVVAVVYTNVRELVSFSVSTTQLMYDGRPVPVLDLRKVAGAQTWKMDTPTLGRAVAQSLGRGNMTLVFGGGAVVASGNTNDLVASVLNLKEQALQQMLAGTLGGANHHVAFKEVPRNLSSRTGNVVRADRFSLFFNYLGARDLALLKNAPAGNSANPDQEVIEQLVLACRLLASTDLGVLTPDGLAHVSARSRVNPQHFYIARDVAPGMVTAADIIEDDLDGNPVGGAQIAQYSERFIHSEIYRARPDVMAVLHAHTPELRVFAQTDVKLRPVTDKAMFIGDGLPLYDIVKYDPNATSVLVKSSMLGRALATLMGKKDGALLLDHGIALADYSLPALVSRAFNLRRNAQIQAMAVALHGKVDFLPALGDMTSEGPARARARYPEWDYWRQLAIGTTDVNVLPPVNGGLPLRPHE